MLAIGYITIDELDLKEYLSSGMMLLVLPWYYQRRSLYIQYNLNIGHVFASPAFPHPDVWVQFHMHSSNFLSYFFLAHLIGLN